MEEDHRHWGSLTPSDTPPRWAGKVSLGSWVGALMQPLGCCKLPHPTHSPTPTLSLPRPRADAQPDSCGETERTHAETTGLKGKADLFHAIHSLRQA